MEKNGSKRKYRERGNIEEEGSTKRKRKAMEGRERNEGIENKRRCERKTTKAGRKEGRQ